MQENHDKSVSELKTKILILVTNINRILLSLCNIAFIQSVFYRIGGMKLEGHHLGFTIILQVYKL